MERVEKEANTRNVDLFHVFGELEGNEKAESGFS